MRYLPHGPVYKVTEYESNYIVRYLPMYLYTKLQNMKVINVVR